MVCQFGSSLGKTAPFKRDYINGASGVSGFFDRSESWPSNFLFQRLFISLPIPLVMFIKFKTINPFALYTIPYCIFV